MKIKCVFISSLITIFICMSFAIKANGQVFEKSSNKLDLNDSIMFLNAGEALQKFEKSDNPIYRASILRKVSERYQAAQLLSTDDSNGIGQIISSGLKDKYSKVAVEAVKNVGLLKRKEFESDLFSIYNNAPALFPGYWEKVQTAIISSLGKMGSDETKTLFKEILSNEGNTTTLTATLLAIKDLNDVSMIEYLDIFCKKMEAAIADARNRGDNPMLYSGFIINDGIAKNAIDSLLAKKGK